MSYDDERYRAKTINVFLFLKHKNYKHQQAF